jgi:DNA-binding transcriptional regulator YdaS (Cro superfamily)
MKTEIEKLVDEFGAYRLAQAVGVKHPSIHSWVRHGRVPAGRVIAVEAATGVSRHRLRPDVYGPAADEERAP